MQRIGLHISSFYTKNYLPQKSTALHLRKCDPFETSIHGQMAAATSGPPK